MAAEESKLSSERQDCPNCGILALKHDDIGTQCENCGTEFDKNWQVTLQGDALSRPVVDSEPEGGPDDGSD